MSRRWESWQVELLTSRIILAVAIAALFGIGIWGLVK